MGLRKMNRSPHKITLCTLSFCLMLTAGIAPSPAHAQASSSSNSSTTANPAPQTPATSSGTATPSAAAKSTTGKPSSSEIAAAKASGKVWVNTETRVYHKGGRWYGKTKQGKFMTEAEAKAAGYKGAKE
jgi:hypothetical protein